MTLCALCSGTINKAAKSVEFNSIPLGKIFVPDILVYECEKCLDQTLDNEQSDLLIRKVKELENKAFAQLPIGEFMSAKETYGYLGISKQALSKDKKIKRGFIYSVKIGTQSFYYKKSVFRFKETRDGRIPLQETQENKNNPKEFESKMEEMLEHLNAINAEIQNTYLSLEIDSILPKPYNLNQKGKLANNQNNEKDLANAS